MRRIVIRACLTLAAAAVLLAIDESRVRKPVAGLDPPAPLSGLDSFETLEDVEKREEWFYFQRAYPFDTLPADARRRARASRPEDWNAKNRLGPAATLWQPLGPQPTVSAFPQNWGVTSGRINSIAISPSDPQLILIGAATGGIWRSADGGTTFVPVTDTQVDLAVGSIAFSRQDPSIVYAGMGDLDGGYLGTGVLKSTDSGASWTRINNDTLNATGQTAKIEVDPVDSNRVYLAQFSALTSGGVFSSALYVSTDGGVNWSRKLPGLACSFAINPSNPQTVYLGTVRVDTPNRPPAGLYRSTDGGDTWANIFASPYSQTIDVKLAVPSGQLIFVYIGGMNDGAVETRVVVSTDGGTTWTNRGGANLDTGGFGYNSYIASHPNQPGTIYVGTRDLFKSEDGGATYKNLNNNFDSRQRFTPNQSNTHTDQHALAFSPADPNVIYVGNDGGLSKSTDGGNTYSSLNGSLSLTQFYGVTLHPVDPAISYGGTQDNGLQRRSREPFRWQELISGDFNSVVVNPRNPSTLVSNYVFATVFRFVDDGNRFDRQIGNAATFGEPAGNPRVAFLAPLAGSGTDGTLYFGTWRLFVSQDFGDSWNSPGGNRDLTKGGSDVLSTIGVGKSSADVIYTGSSQGRAMVSPNGGADWTDITSGLPNRFITGITVDDTNSAVAYLTVSGFGSGHVFKTTNTGATWTDISGNFPNIPANAIAIDPGDPGVIYAATDIGVFRSTVDGRIWFGFNEGLPPTVVYGFSTHPSGSIQAATYGRGVYELRVAPASPPTIVAVVQESKKVLRIDGTTFGVIPRVRINGVDKTDFVATSSPVRIVLKAKPKKLGLIDGNNSIQVVSLIGESNVFSLTR